VCSIFEVGDCFPRRDLGQGDDERKIVVGGDAVVPLEAAGKTLVNDYVLALSPGECADGSHHRATGAGAISRMRAVDVPREQAQGAVIALAATHGKGADEGPTVPAAEILGATAPV